MSALSPLARRAVQRLAWYRQDHYVQVSSAEYWYNLDINALVATVESLVLATAYGDIPKPADDFQRQLDTLAEAHGARLAALERVVNVHAD